MVNLLVVEDEAIIRNGILNHLPWERLGITKVWAAGNAEEAFEIYNEIRPDIVLTDINMPGMNGIEMCRRMRLLSEDTQFIFLTGYVEKEYLRGAIDLQAVRYIEKPIVMSEVQEAVSQAVKNIEKKWIQKEAVLHRLLMEDKKAQNEILGDMNYCQMILLHVKKTGVISEIKTYIERTESLQNKEINVRIMDIINSRTLVILLGKRNNISDQKSILYIFMNIMEKIGKWSGDWFVAVGSVEKREEGISRCYSTASETMRSIGWRGWNRCAFYPCEQNEYVDMAADTGMLTDFEMLISKRKYQDALEIMNRFWKRQIDTKTLVGYQLYYIANRFNSLISQKNYFLSDSNRQLNGADEREISKFETIEEIRQYLEKCLKQRIQIKEEDVEGDQKANYIVEKIIRYIHENYENPDLSLKVLSEYVYLTPTYLSNLFKKKTGNTIGQYMTDVRLDEAKKRIRDPKYKLYEISTLVGYRDANYFAKTFKKKTGYTPSEYREAGKE